MDKIIENVKVTGCGFNMNQVEIPMKWYFENTRHKTPRDFFLIREIIIRAEFQRNDISTVNVLSGYNAESPGVQVKIIACWKESQN